MASTRRWNPFARWRRAATVGAEPPAPRAPAARVAGAPISARSTVVQPSTAAPQSTDPGHASAASSDELRDGAGIDRETLEERRVRFFCWLVAAPPATHPGPPPAAAVARVLEHLDRVIATDSLRAALLPRAPQVVPQLMKTLRDERYSSLDVAQRISKDVVLTAEVVRSATSAFRRGDGNGESDGEIDLARAVAMIGTQGLRRAIANVVLRPIFDARGDSLSSRAAPQTWKDADKKARLCAAIAAQGPLDPFDGYLAGLLHNCGWTAALRAIDGLQDVAVSAADLAHADVVPGLRRRRDALFGAFVETWKLGPALDGLAAELLGQGIDAARSPLAAALRDAEELAARHALAPAGEPPAASVPLWASLPKPVQDCYAALSRA